MVEVWINGFKYFADDRSQTLYLNENKQGGNTSYRYLTANERMQLETWTQYNGKPMLSF